ncbi:MAG TPA: nickel pincer cofactor biosynthesis protein LarC, partial [Acidobacteriota bacterium]|nr:nickel pincer cofactor biosynthesis protein LarC [Acidobacteriota bacterium]
MTDTVLYIEAASGVSGDMLLGAFLDLGVPVETLNAAWSALGIDNYEIEISEVMKAGLRALQCRVRTEEQKGPRSWKEYRNVLERSGLNAGLRNNALLLCRKLFEIEAGLHGSTISRLHLHEIGGSDLLIDVIGALAAVDSLRPARIAASPVNTGRGFVRFSHGILPVPAPATTKLLEGVPVFQNEVEGELATPTGALLLTHLAQSYGPMPPLTLLRTGAGAGERETPGRPNVLRMFLGTADAPRESGEDTWMAETNIDDSNPQVLAYFMEKAFEEGALDVFFTPIFMKKNRPGVRLSVLAARSSLDTILGLLFAET